jgi:hypothetical protein
VGCQSTSEVTQGPQSIVNGNIFASNISLPDVPRAPEGLSPITASGTYSSGSNNGGRCMVDNSKTPAVTHCLLGNINLSESEEVEFNTTNGPMQLYLQCDPQNNSPCSGPNITLSGNAAIKHCKNGSCTATASDPTELALFGNPARTSEACSQTIGLSGGSSATVMFAYLPDACGGIHGGSSNPDLVGALWVKSFGPVGSSSNRAELLVPDDMGARVFTRFGNSFALSIRDFVAIGINNWASFQMPQSATGMFR